jgi:hypothetical protein
MLRLTPLALLLALSACSPDATEAGGGSAAGGASDSGVQAEEATPKDASAEELAIIDSFRGLQAACAERDGAKAHEHFAVKTRDHWMYIKGLALNADKPTLRRESMVVQLAVLVLRAKAGFETLEVLDEPGMIQYALDANLLGNQMVVGIDLHEIEINGQHAESGAMQAQGREPLQIRYGFAFEDGMWRVDLTPAYRMADEIFAAKREAHGVTDDEEQALYFLVGNATGVGGTEELWTPLADLTDN